MIPHVLTVTFGLNLSGAWGERLYSVPVQDEEPGDALRPRVRHHGLEELVDGDLQPIRGEDVVT